MKILLVDDEVKNLELLEALLYPQGYQMTMASTGEEALKILGETRTDMVLLDVMLPGISGIDVLKTIRANEALQTLPVLLITALSEREHKIEGLKAGADDYVTKPFDKNELLARVKTLAQLSYLRRQLAEKEKFERILEATNDGIVVTDQKFTPVTVNRAAMELLQIGGEQPQNIFMHINQIFKGGITLDPLEKDFKSYILTRPETNEYGPLYLSTIIHKVKNTSGVTTQYIFIFKNITAEHLEKELKFNFLSLISHKLRTPLTVMGISIELLSTALKDAAMLEYVGKIGKSHKELDNTHNRLLHFIEMDKKGLNETVSVSAFDGYVSACEKKYHVVCEFNKTVTTDNCPFWQSMVIEELVDNAFKFFSGSKLQLYLVVNAGLIELSDNGPGIPPEEKEKVVEAFYQIEKYFTGQVPGMGLGLALVKRLVKLHNGSIEFESNLNRGTTVRIRLNPPN